MRQRFLLLLLSLLITPGCVQTIAVRSTGTIVDYGLEAINEESDLQLAEQSIASDLKLVEGLIKADPSNERLLLMASRGFGSYALGFVEDNSPDRARVFYLRARDYGLRILTQHNEFGKGWERDFETFQRALSTMKKDDVPAIFWTANAWANYIRLTLSDPAAIADLPKVEALLRFVVEKEDSYYFGSSHVALGVLLASRPKILGGDPDKARAHFERALDIGKGKFFMAHVYYAMSYAVQVQDKGLFSSLLQKVEEGSLEVLPEQRLANAIAKRKAKKLLETVSDLFE
jgi:hypothetical protein